MADGLEQVQDEQLAGTVDMVVETGVMASNAFAGNTSLQVLKDIEY